MFKVVLQSYIKFMNKYYNLKASKAKDQNKLKFKYLRRSYPGVLVYPIKLDRCPLKVFARLLTPHGNTRMRKRSRC